MGENLVIVESPAKAKTIEKFLGEGYVVKSSYGHIRDLPKNNDGIDVEHGFAPKYEVSPAKKTVVADLKKNAKEAKNVFVKIDTELTAAGKKPVSWNFTTMPSEDWKNGVGSALTQYAAGTGDWDGVVTAFVDGWADEYAKNNG